MRSWLALAPILLLALLPSFTGGAQGHAEYVSSDPPSNWVLTEPPTRMTVTLTESLQQGTAKLRMTNATGEASETGPVEVSEGNPRRIVADQLPALDPGVYTVTWSVVSAVDGHFTAGSFSFGILNPDGTLPGSLPPSDSGAAPRVGTPPEIALRILSFLGLAVALGGVAFLSSVWRPAWSSGSLDARDQEVYGEGTRKLLRLARLAALLFAGAVVGWWILTLALAPPATAGDLVASQFLLSLALRLGLGLALVLVLTLTLARLGTGTVPRRPSPWVFVALVLGLAAVLAGSLGSHGAAAVTLAPLGILADTAHLLGVSLWFGGLLAVVRVRVPLREDAPPRRALGVLRRFSRLAFFSVGLVLVAGLTLSLILVGTFEEFLGTAYGLVVLGKISLFVPMLALGALNRYRVLPSPDPEQAVVRAARNVRFEAVLGASVLALAGVLTSMSPAIPLSGAQVGDAPLSLSTTDQGIRLDLDVLPYPTLPGIYAFSLLLWDESTGAPYNDGRNATLTFKLLDDPSLGTQEVFLPGPHGNHFGGESSGLSRSGTWELGLHLTRLGGFDLFATFQITVGGS